MQISISRSIVWAAALAASLALAGCGPDSPRIESRVTELETLAERQQQQVTTLATAMLISHASVFDSPLRQFFAAADFGPLVFGMENSVKFTVPIRTSMTVCDNWQQAK